MRTIGKYNVGTGNFEVEKPEGAQVLDVQLQGSEVQMWALVDPKRSHETRRFVTYGTGHLIEKANSLNYLGTFQVDYLVFHLFERED